MESNKLYAIVPLGIPSLGKSFLFQAIKANTAYPSFAISSDESRKTAIDELIASNPTMPKQEAFEKSYKKAKVIYETQLKTILNTKLTAPITFILLDKNHLPNNLHQTATLVNQINPNAVPMLLISKEDTPFKTSKGDSYYFSLHTIVHCMQRLLNREKHDTLDNEDKPKSLGVFLSFLKEFRNFELSLSRVEEAGFAGYFEAPLTNHLFDCDWKVANDLLESSLQDVAGFKVSDYKNITKLIDFVTAVKPIPQPDLVDYIKNLVTNLGKRKEPDSTKVKVAPKKAPMFLGLEIEQSKDDILGMIKLALAQSKLKWGDSEKAYLGKLEELIVAKSIGGKSKWKYPNTYHVTVIFIGKDLKLEITSHEAYKAFQQGKKLKITVPGIVIALGKIIFAVTMVDTPIANKFPHITMLTGQYPPKMSNAVAEALFDTKCPAYEVYCNYKTKKYEDGYQDISVYLGSDKVQCSVISFAKPIELDAIAKEF